VKKTEAAIVRNARTLIFSGAPPNFILPVCLIRLLSFLALDTSFLDSSLTVLGVLGERRFVGRHKGYFLPLLEPHFL